MRVLEALADAEEPLTLTALDHRASIPVATCATILNSLEGQGYASRTVVGRSHYWRPTLRLFSLGMKVARRSGLGPQAGPHLRWLSDRVGAPAHLGVLEHGSLLYVAKAITPGMVQFNTHVGKEVAFNQTALGRAIVAFLPPAEQDDLIGQAQRGRGPKAGLGVGNELRRQFVEIRQRGYAIEDEEEEAGIACLAAPVLGADGLPVAAVGTTGMADDLLGPRQPAVAEAVVESARRVSGALGVR